MEVTGKPQVLLGVTGCIAAYKACELVRLLQRAGADVRVIMTPNATRFVGATTFRALSGHPVATSLWDEPADRVQHIEMAESADVMVIAPATANVIAKVARGFADDIVTTVALATRAPLVVAPAMNVAMWQAEVTQDNVAALRARGAAIVAPETGELACGAVGEGRLAEIADIADAVLRHAAHCVDLADTRVLVTAGPTHEPIDPVRFIGNRSSGKTGYAIAEEAARRGAQVTLVSGPTELADPFGVKVVRVETAEQMHAAAETAFEYCDVFVASAAVADVRPVGSSDGKVHKGDLPKAIELERTTDILGALGSRKGERYVVGFAAETGDPVPSAREKLAAKGADLVVANDVASGLGFGTTDNRVWFVSAEGVEELPVMSKRVIARKLWDRIVDEDGLAPASDRGEAS